MHEAFISHSSREIWTNESLNPKEAIYEASRNLTPIIGNVRIDTDNKFIFDY